MLYERILLLSAIGFAVVAAGAGWYLAIYSGDHHWLNRAGAAMVAMEGIIALAEFRRRGRLTHIHDTALNTKEAIDMGHQKAVAILESEINKAELNVLAISILLAMIGELLHGFGDILL